MLYLGYTLVFVGGSVAAFLLARTGKQLIQPAVQSTYDEFNSVLREAYYTEFDASFFVGVKYIGALVLLIVGGLLLNSWPFGVALAFLAFLLPNILLERIVSARRAKLEEQLSDLMTALSASIKSGMTLEETIGEIADHMRPPIAQEFAVIRERINAGQTIVEALREADKQMDLPRASIVLQALAVGQERGGKLSTLMEDLSESVREIARVEERIKTETAGLILSSRIMVGMPFLTCGLLSLIEPNQITMLFNTLHGNIILIVAIVLNVFAFRMMAKITNLDV